MAGEAVKVIEIQAAEVEEIEWLPVDEHRITVRADRAVRETPVADVVTGLTHNVHAVEQPGHDIEPLLVDEETEAGIGDALRVDAATPPVQEPLPGCVLADADESGVVDAGFPNVGKAGLAAIVGHIAGEVGREEDGVLVEQRIQPVQLPVDA